MADTGAASAAAPTQKTEQPRGPSQVIAPGRLPLKNPRVIASILALAGTTLAAEMYLPAGVWSAALHPAIVFLGLWLARPRDVYVLATIASGLVVAGAVLTATGTWPATALKTLSASPDLANRLIVLFAIWALAAVLAGSKRREASLRGRIAKERARRKAIEVEAESHHSVPRPSDLEERVYDAQDLGHEIRTLLNAILGFSEAAKAEIFGPIADPRYRDYMTHINQSGWSLLQVFERHLAADPLPQQRPDPGTRRTQGDTDLTDGETPAATAVNE